MSLTTFALWTAAPLVAAGRATGATATYRRASLAAGIATVTAFVTGGVLMARGGGAGLGAAQRAMVGVALTWFALVAD